MRREDMNPIPFYKMSGAGNDFIIIDNRNQIVADTELSSFIASVCRRKLSAGADGLILIEASDKFDFRWRFFNSDGSDADFRWRFFNSDGSNAEMCGNGARCAARFAQVSGCSFCPGQRYCGNQLVL
jgi:diaminopimelate epimerase